MTRSPASTCACPSASRPASTSPPSAKGSRSTPGSCARPRLDSTASRGSGAASDEPRPGPSTTRAGPADLRPEEGPTMTTFDTPDPITVDLEVGVGDVRIEATDRRDTTVQVRPSDPATPTDV